MVSVKRAVILAQKALIFLISFHHHTHVGSKNNNKITQFVNIPTVKNQNHPYVLSSENKGWRHRQVLCYLMLSTIVSILNVT